MSNAQNIAIIQKQVELFYTKNGYYPDPEEFIELLYFSDYFATPPVPPEGMEFFISPSGTVSLEGPL